MLENVIQRYKRSKVINCGILNRATEYEITRRYKEEMQGVTREDKFPNDRQML